MSEKLDEMAEVKKFIGMSDPETEKLRAERAEQDRQRQATIMAKRRELADLETSMATVGGEAETQIRAGFKALALYFAHARTKRRLITDLNGLTGERQHLEHEGTLIESTSRWIGGQIKSVVGKMTGFGVIRFALSTVLLDPDKPLFKRK
jgi:hypothetical protein